MPRVPSFTDDIELISGSPVPKPKKDSSPDLEKWIEQLTIVDKATRQTGNKDISIPFIVAADRPKMDKEGNPVLDDDGKPKMSSPSKTVKLRFQQAATEMGIGVSVVIRKVPGDDTKMEVLVATSKRRERKTTETADTPETATVAPRTSAPVGLPKPGRKAS